MIRRYNNWSYRDVTTFLKENGFEYLKPLKGSHEAWARIGEPDKYVEVSQPGDSYHPKILRKMIWESGIDKEDWINWGNS